jgi:FKBP-type peptidyl-prolyl cis-trans isomerase SlyD
MKIENNHIVSIRYRLTNEKGAVLDQSPDGEPLVYLHGAAGVLPALEAALTGKKVGESFDVTITPSDGFGEHQPSLIQNASRSDFPDEVELQVGMQVTAQTPQGDQQVTVTAFDNDVVTVDANHPLAGMTLRFQGEVEDVRAASEAEIQHWPNPVPA